MDECELKATCVFLNETMCEMPAMAGIYKERYCDAGRDECARYRVFRELGREKVPYDLYPNQLDRSDEILAG